MSFNHIISDESKQLFREILRYASWIENICNDYEESHQNSTMKPEYVEEYRETAQSIFQEADLYMIYNDVSMLKQLEKFISEVHDGVIERVQTRHICSQEQIESILKERSDEIKQYGFYKNGSGFVEVE